MSKHIRSLVFATFVATSLTSCSLRYDFTECAVDSDCEKFNTSDETFSCRSDECVGSPAEAECERDSDCTTAPRTSCEANMCVDPMVETDTGGEDVTTEDMPTADTPDMPVDMGTPCTQHSQCNADIANPDSLCVEGFCRVALTDECTEIGGDISTEDTLVVGIILPISPPYENIGPPFQLAIELATDEINTVGGLPRGERIAYIACDDKGNSTVAQTAATHLAENLKVPAIVGPLFSTPFIDVVTNITRDTGTFTISPTASSANISTLSDNGFAWRTISSDRFQAQAVLDRIADQPNINRVQIFYKDDAYGNGLFNGVAGRLTQRLGSQSVKSAAYADPATFNFDPAQISAEFNSVIGGALGGGFSPDLILLIGTTEANLLAGGYQSAVTGGGGGPVPMLFTHGGVPDMPNLANANAGFAPLLDATAPNIFNGVNFQTYQTRFGSKFPGEPFITTSPLSYDAFIVTLFSAAFVPENEPITGAAIVANMTKVADPAAEAVAIEYQEPTFISDAFQAIGAGMTIKYGGPSGQLNFDFQTGDIRSDYLSFGVIDPGNGFTIRPEDIYLLADKDTGFWTNRCDASMGLSCSDQTDVCGPPTQLVCLSPCGGDPDCMGRGTCQGNLCLP